jgi:hypothetical protein
MMKKHHDFSITEMENMLPWERDINVQLAINHTQEENKRLSDAKKKAG